MSAAVHTLQNRFNGGEVSPLLDGRVDADAYRGGARVLENFIVRPHGGVFKRPGTEYLGRCKADDSTRLYGFKRSTETNYILEIGGGYIRFWKGGKTATKVEASILDVDAWAGSSSSGAWVTATSYSVGTQRTNKGIVWRCIQAHTSSATDAPGAGANWSLYWAEIPDYEVGDLVKIGFVIYYCKTKHYPSASFASDTAYWHEFTDGYEIPTPYAAEDVFGLQFCQLNDILFIAHPDYPPKRLSRFSETRWVFEDVPFQFAPSLDVNETRINVQVQFDGVPRFGMPWVTATDYQTGDRVHGIGAGVVGRVYECILGHTSSAAGAGGNEPGVGATSTTYWTLISSTGYAVGDRVTAVDNGSTVNPFAGQIFTCHTAYNPGTTSNDEPGLGTAWQDYWNEGTSRVKIAQWANATAYVQGQKVRRGKVIYECTRAHVSALNSKPVRPGGAYTKGNSPGDGDLWARVWKISAADTDLSGLRFALVATEDLFTSDDINTIWLLELGGGGNYEQITTPNANNTASTENYPLFVQGGYLVTSAWDTDDALLGTISIQESLDGVVWSTIKQFTQTNKGDGNISYSGEAPTIGAWYRITATATNTSTAQSKIKIEATSAVIKLPFKITSLDGTTPATKALGNLVMPKDQLPPPLVIGASTPLWRRPGFSPQDGYPASVSFHDSRIWWGGTRNYPARMWASQTEDYYNFLTGALDTDGLDLTLAAVESNAIQWMASFNRSLVIGTTGDEWTVDSGETDEALKPSNVRARRRTRYGSDGVPPQLTGESLLWSGRNGRSIYEFAYEFQRDAYTAPDMTVLSEHILGNGLAQTAFQSSIDPILWCVLNNGQLAGMSYNREQKVVAWHRHITGRRLPHVVPLGGDNRDDFKSVATIYGDYGDEVWFVVRRQDVGGVTGYSYYMERFNPGLLAWSMGAPEAALLPGPLSDADDRWKYMDCHSFYSAEGALGHLSGRDVVYTTPEGEVSPQNNYYTVDETGTAVDCPTFVTCGLPFVSILVLPRLELMLQTGTIQARNMSVNRMVLRTWKSRGGSWYIFEDQDIEARYGANALFWPGRQLDYNGFIWNMAVTPIEQTQPAHESYTGQLQEVHTKSTPCKNPQVCLYSDDGLPFNLLALILKIEVTGE